MQTHFATLAPETHGRTRFIVAGRGIRSLHPLLVLAVGLAACRDTTPTVGPPANTRPSYSMTVDTSWNTYSAVVTVTTQDSSRPAWMAHRALSYRVTERLQGDGSWNTVIEPRNDLPQQSRGVARIENRGGVLHAYDRAGAGIDLHPPQHAVTPFFSKTPLASQDLVRPAGTGTGNGVHTRKGKGWADHILARWGAGNQARLANARFFGSAPVRDGDLLRYSRQQPDGVLEVAVDSLTGATMEVRKRTDGVIAFHVQNSYTRTPAGDLVLRETRVEHTPEAGASPRIIITRYDSVSFARGGI